MSTWVASYRAACAERGISPIPGADTAVSGGALNLPGNVLERFSRRITDADVEVLCGVFCSLSGRELLSDWVTLLDLSYNMIGDCGARTIADTISATLGSPVPLQGILLASNNITSVGAEALGAALCNPASSVATLSLRGNTLGDAGLAALASALRDNMSLIALDVENTDAGVKGLSSLLVAVRDNVALSVLNISRPLLRGPSDVQSVVQHLHVLLRHNSTLGHLSLNFMGLTDSDLEALLPALIDNVSLQCLDLRGNRLHGDSGAHLAKLVARNPRISHLDLSYNRLGDRGIAQLMDKLQKCTSPMEALLLESNDAGDAGLIAVAHALPACPNLRILTLWGNDFSPAAESALFAHRQRLEAMTRRDVDFFVTDNVPHVTRV